jgi:hypothetical protein
MGFQKIAITFSQAAQKATANILYIVTSNDRSISLISDAVGASTGTFEGSATVNGTAENIYNAIVRDLNASNVFGPTEVEYNGTDTVSISILDESVTSITATTSGDFAGSTSTTTSTLNTGDVYSADKKINVRSPYMFEATSVGGTDVVSSASLDIYVYNGIRFSNRPTSPTYRIISAAPKNDSTSIYFNVSEYAKDFFINHINTSLYESTNYFIDVFPSIIVDGVQISRDPEFFTGFYGYGYFEDGANPQNDSGLLQSNYKILKLDDAEVVIPVDTSKATQVTYELNGQLVYTKAISSSVSSVSQIGYVTSADVLSHDFEKRVLNDEGIFEGSQCLSQFENDFSLFDFDTIYIDTDNEVIKVDVENIYECKYEPILLSFINKFGAIQKLWFFKNNSVSMNTESKSFRRNTIINGGYESTEHQYKNLFKHGKESITINSGFYPESFNEVFREIMLSEDVWIYYNEENLPVNIKNSDIKFKTRLDDKLIEYKLDCEFAFDKIQNIT